MNANIDISSVVLTTERLILRPWQLGDLQDLYDYASVDGVGQLAGWRPHKYRWQSLEILRRFIDEKNHFAVEYRENGLVIGSLGIERYEEARFPEFDGMRCREINYVLSKDYWSRGLTSEAVQTVIRYLFTEVGLDAILCGHFNSNNQSARVQEKCGFRYYATGRVTTQRGTVKDQIFDILTKEDWLLSHR
ncbi:MAG: GNAT family N-acetyltransferase [Ruminococcaceae bacterium]|jgi:ribosomal-protein-alanine N-acetyltransferase|nr:GNAT family N-acetyltransferase [Oscillospiraceae bacterium]